jgi:dynein heavy chain
LASLTDTTHKMEGVTVLYIPKEGADLTPEQASKNKDLVQRLESKQFLYIIILFQKII